MEAAMQNEATTFAHRGLIRITAFVLLVLAGLTPAAAQPGAAQPPSDAEQRRDDPTRNSDDGSAHTEPVGFEHLRTGFALEGAHIDAGCETCHARQIFEGTPRRCSQCHVTGGTLATTAKPLQHVPTVQECDQCHDQYSWSGAYFVHGPTTTGRCTSCHNGASAPGKPSNHIPTTLQCETCHRTDGWLPVNLGGAVRRGRPGVDAR
jgi:hypothetical protein